MSIQKPTDIETYASQSVQNQIVDTEVKGVSAFSIKSLDIKQEAEQIRKSKSVLPEDLPMQPYTKTQFIEVWQMYMDHLIQHGRRVQAANLTNYQVQDHVICVEVLNETIQSELLLSKEEILSFVRQKLQNYSVDMLVRVGVQESQPQVFTLQDKYQRMLEQNPLLEEFRRVFDLDF